MDQVFTSYKRDDSQIVNSIVEKLSQAGLRVWIDRSGIKVGTEWPEEIVEAIETCPAFVLMLSPLSAQSVYVQQEIFLSFQSQKQMFIVELQKTELPKKIKLHLAGKQIISVEKSGLEKVTQELVEELKKYVAQFEPPENRQAEVVIQGIPFKDLTPDIQAQLLDRLAELTGADRSKLQIARLASGSVHVFIDMPRQAAYRLKTAALNKDPRLKQLHIVTLRLDGDQTYINVATGQFTALATVSPLMALWLKIPALFSSVLGATGGKIATLIIGAALVAGAGTAVSKAIAPVPVPSPTPTSTLALTATVEPSTTPTVALTETSLPTETATVTLTPTETLTPGFTPSPVPTYLTLRGVPTRRIACNYGPGNNYLYQEVMNPINNMDVFGKALIYNRGREETWLYTQGDGYEKKCFVNAADVQLTGGTLDDLKVVYPGEVTLPGSIYTWPEPQNVEAIRQGNQVVISWDFFDLPAGEREDDTKPRYMLELWLCQDGELRFTPTGSWEVTQKRPTVQVTDEASCSEPSHGRIYLAEKHGYKGPVEIPWPVYPQVTATP